jgi:hypothetical protein
MFATPQVVQWLVLRGWLDLDFGSTAYTTTTYLSISDTGLYQLGALQGGDKEPLKMALQPAAVGSFRGAGGSGSQKRGRDGESAAAADGPAVEALRRWRAGVAAADGVFEQCVLSDARLAAAAGLPAAATPAAVAAALGLPPTSADPRIHGILSALRTTAAPTGGDVTLPGPDNKKPRAALH